MKDHNARNPVPWTVKKTEDGEYRIESAHPFGGEWRNKVAMVFGRCAMLGESRVAGNSGSISHEQAETNAELIVRAVNAHEQMVGALESVAQAFAVEHIAEVIPPSVMAKVKAALRAAKGEQ